MELEVDTENSWSSRSSPTGLATSGKVAIVGVFDGISILAAAPSVSGYIIIMAIISSTLAAVVGNLVDVAATRCLHFLMPGSLSWHFSSICRFRRQCHPLSDLWILGPPTQLCKGEKTECGDVGATT